MKENKNNSSEDAEDRNRLPIIKKVKS